MIENRECVGCYHYTIISYLGINFYDSCMDCPSNVPCNTIKPDKHFTSYNGLLALTRDPTEEEGQAFKDALRHEAEIQTLKIMGGYWDKTFTGGYTEEEIWEFMSYRCKREDTDWSLTYDCSQTKNKATVFFDADKLANRMPGRNRGYTKSGVKPTCPICRITVDEYGYCPECLNRIRFRHNRQGNIIAMVGEDSQDAYNTPSIAIYWTRGEGNQKVELEVKEYEHNWLPRDDIKHKYNFQGYVNKKSDGRCNRTGDIGDPKSPLYMQQYRHDVQVVLSPNIEVTGEIERVFSGPDKKSIRKVKAELKGCPECGCPVKLQDMRRGDTVCPKCGLVLKQTLYVVEGPYNAKDKTGGYERETGDILERGFEVGEL